MTFAGVLPSLEVRFPVSPHLVLIATWVDLPDIEAPVEGGEADAVLQPERLHNREAERQWFCLPGSSVPAAIGLLRPLSAQLFPATMPPRLARRAAVARGPSS